jgi:hypothetical protein
MINPPNLTKKTTLILWCFFSVTLPKLAQSSVQSETPKWLPHIATETKQNQNDSALTKVNADSEVEIRVFYNNSEEKTSINSEPITYKDKFALPFKPDAALSLNNKPNNLYTNIYVDNKKHHLIVTKDYNIDIKEVQIFNALSELILTWKIHEDADSYLLELKPRLPAGAYLTKISTNKGINNKKIIIE